MTVSTTSRRAKFLGNDSTTEFPFEFKVFSDEDIALTRIDDDGRETALTLDSDFSVALNADQDNDPGGTITYPLSGDPLADEHALVALGGLSETQGTDITNMGRFLPQTLENALDYLTILIQQLREKLDRALVVSQSNTGALPSLNGAVSRAGLYVAFDANGNPTAASGTGADSGLRTDLVAATGALLVSFRSSGVGAVLRSLWAVLMDLPISVKNFGATGDGVTDDAADINAAFTYAATVGGTVLFPPGIYRIKSPLHLNGTVSARSLGAVLLFDHTGSFTDGSTGQLLVRFGKTTTWSGVFEGFEIKFTAAFSNVYALVVRAAENFAIRNNYLNGVKATVGGSMICSEFIGLGTGAATLGAIRGSIEGNRVIFDPTNTKCEGGSIQGWWYDIIIKNNQIVGNGDDAFALHGGKRILLADNYFETKIGRILLASGRESTDSHLRDVIVSRNTLRKINSSAGNAGIQVNPVNDLSEVATNIDIIDNTIINDDSTYDFVYPILLRGGKNVTVARNRMVNNRGAGQFDLRATEYSTGAVTFWLDNVIIEDNKIFGGKTDIGQVASTGNRPIIFRNNFADGQGFVDYPIKSFLSSTRGERAYGNIGINGLTADVYNGESGGAAYHGAECVGEFFGTGITTDTVLDVVGMGSDYLYMARKLRPIRLEVRFSAKLPVGAGCYLEFYKYDGSVETLLGTTSTFTAATGARNIASFTGPVFLSTLSIPENEAIKVRIRAASTIGGLGCVVKVFGEYIY